MAQGKIKRSHVALRHEMVLKILRNLTRYKLPMEEMEKFRVALTRRLSEVLKVRPNGGKQLKIVHTVIKREFINNKTFKIDGVPQEH